MHANRIFLMITVFCIPTGSLVWGEVANSRPFRQSDEADQTPTRTVKIVAPSITCFSRFEDGLKARVKERNDWVHSVKLKALHKKIVMPRPEYDFGNDVEIEFQINKNKPVSELAKAMIKQGFSGDSILTAGHKMSDYKNIPLKALIKKTD